MLLLDLEEHIWLGEIFTKTCSRSNANPCSKLQSIVPVNKLIIISCA